DASVHALLGGNANLAQLGVAPPAPGEALGVRLDTEGALAAEDPRLGRGREPGDGAETQMGHRPALEGGEDIHVLGHLHVVPGPALVTPARHGDLSHGHHAARRTDPAHHGLVPDTHVEDVVAAPGDVVAPVQGPLGHAAGTPGPLHL